MYLARAPEGKPVAKVGNVSAGHTPLVAATAAYAPVRLASSAEVLRGQRGNLLAWRPGQARQDLSGLDHLVRHIHAVGLDRAVRHSHSVFLIRVPWKPGLAHLSDPLVRQVLPGNQVRHIRAASLGHLARLPWKPDSARQDLSSQPVRHQIHAVVRLNHLVRVPWTPDSPRQDRSS